MTRTTRCVLGLGVLEVSNDGSPSASPPMAQHYVILLRLLDLEYKDKVKGKDKVIPLEARCGPEDG